MRVAGGSAFAAMMVGFAFLVARWDLSRARRDGRFSVFAAMVSLVSFVGRLVFGRPVAVLLKQAPPCSTVHDSAAAWCSGWRLHPTNVVASTMMRGVLK